VSFTWSSPTSITTPFSSSAYLPTSPIPETYTNNALQYAFIRLLGCGGGSPSAPTCGSASVPMPPSVSGITYPSFDSGQLAPATSQTAVGFPNIPIPGLASFLSNIGYSSTSYGGNQAWPSFVYDFGPQCPEGYPISKQNNPALYCVDYTSQSGVPTIAPPTIEAVLTPYVPTVGADGNENVGGGDYPASIFARSGSVDGSSQSGLATAMVDLERKTCKFFRQPCLASARRCFMRLCGIADHMSRSALRRS
jgi:hypothetical protein